MSLGNEYVKENFLVRYRYFAPLTVIGDNGSEILLRDYLVKKHIVVANIASKKADYWAEMFISPKDIVIKPQKDVYVYDVKGNVMGDKFVLKEGTMLLRHRGGADMDGQVFELIDAKSFNKNYYFIKPSDGILALTQQKILLGEEGRNR